MLLKLVTAKTEVSGVSRASLRVRSFVWEKPAGFSFYPGQYLDYTLSITDPDGPSRSFTIASSPTEEFLMLTTREGRSVFKKKLFTLKSGETIESSHPAGTFILDESTPAVMIAGGVGITPFRSMIKYAVDKNLSLRSRTLPFDSQKVKNLPITLIYLNSDDNFPFKEELETWKQQLPNLNIVYHNFNQSGHLTHLPSTIHHLPIYYLAGPPKMVNSFDQMLQSLGVDKTNIRYDHFDGYL